jgi:hypothetical protein
MMIDDDKIPVNEIFRAVEHEETPEQYLRIHPHKGEESQLLKR